MALDDDAEAALRREFDETKAALSRVNNESKTHRLNSDRFGRELDEARATRERELAELTTARDAALAELTGKLTAAEQAAADRDKASRERVTQADLKLAAKDAGIADMDVLKLLNRADLKLGEDGEVTNAAEVIAALKKAKPWAFGQPTTGSTATPPSSDGTKVPKSYAEMTADERLAFQRQTGQRR